MASPPAQPGEAPEQAEKSRGRPLLWIVVVVVVGGAAVYGLTGSEDQPAASSDAVFDTTGRLLTAGGDGPSDEPEESWSERVDCEGRCAVGAVESALIVAEADGDRSTVRALDGSTGDEIWSERTGSDELVTAINVFDGIIFLSLESIDGYQLSAWDPAEGDEMWTEDAENVRYGDGVVVVHDWNEGSEGAVSRALTTTTGDELWEEDGAVTGICGSTAVLHDDDDLLALDLGTGDQKWSESVGDYAPAGCSGSRAFVIEDEDVAAFDLDSGEELWSERVRGASTMFTLDDVLIVRTDGDVIGLAAATGEEVWSVDQDDFPAYQVIDLGGEQALGRGDGRATVVDLTTGDDIDSTRTGDGNLIFGTSSFLVLDDDEVTAHRMVDVEEQWSVDVDDEAMWLAASDRALFVLLPDEVVSYE